MKPSSMPTLSLLLLFAFLINLPLLAFSADVEPVLDTNGNPISSKGQYFIVPATRGGGGGLRLGPTGTSKCPVTVLQDYFQSNTGMPAKFTLVGTDTDIIFPGAHLRIEYVQTLNCASSSVWWLYGQRSIPGRLFAGIGSARDNPDIFSGADGGNFTIKTSGCGYKLSFCQPNACFDLGLFDNQEGGRRLVTRANQPFEVSFVNVNNVAYASKFHGPNVVKASKFHAPNVVKTSKMDEIVIRSVA